MQILERILNHGIKLKAIEKDYSLIPPKEKHAGLYL